MTAYQIGYFIGYWAIPVLLAIWIIKIIIDKKGK